MKTFFDGVFLEKQNFIEEGLKYPIRLEYFKTSKKENVKTKFGIKVVKTEYLDGKTKVETKEVNDITEDIKEIEKILMIMKNNTVTPIGVDDVLSEILSLSKI